MKKTLNQFGNSQLTFGILFFIVLALFTSCKDITMDITKPSWLGESIYDLLSEGYEDDKGNVHTISVYVKLINDVGYTEVLRRTGSKTLFVADDEAFERFFQQNDWGVRSYDQLTIAQKKLILNSAMINNAYLIEMLSSTEGPTAGQAFRRNTALSIYDSISFCKADKLPSTQYWLPYKDKGIMIMKDMTPTPMLHFLQKQMDYKGITNEDFSVLFNGKVREKDDVHIYGVKVIIRDITCKNGYVNILEEVMIPPVNMAENIFSNPETSMFSALLERFSAPYYSPSATKEYALLTGKTDSIYVKHYFSERGAGGATLSNPNLIAQKGILEFDPGWNGYTMSTNTTMQTDMAAIFVPENNALNEWFNNGGGKFLKSRYTTLENIPDEVIDDLLRNHMKASFLGSTPGKFAEVVDDAKESMGIQKSDISKSFVCSNGVVYVTKKVYAPASYVAVIAPTLINENMRIINWAVKQLQFNAYLLSMDSYYSFIIPTDDALKKYIDPVSLAKNQPEVLKFWYNSKATSVNDQVKASVYAYNPVTGVVGDSLRLAGYAEIIDRLEDILDYHIIVGDIENSKTFYQSKGGGSIKVNGTGVGMNIYGGANIESGNSSNVTAIYDQTKETNGRGNGKSYVVNTLLQPSFRSVYSEMSKHEEFSEFFKLLQGNDEATSTEHNLYDIFYKDPSYAGLDYNVKFFNTFHYTIYIPTNEKIREAILNGLPTWEQIKSETDATEKTRKTEKLIRFLKYHFQDNSVYIDGSSKTGSFETATLNPLNQRFYKLSVTSNGSNLKITSASGITANIITSGGLFNLMARDYKFNNRDPKAATAIETSSFAVLHQIDDVLLYKTNQLSE